MYSKLFLTFMKGGLRMYIYVHCAVHILGQQLNIS